MAVVNQFKIREPTDEVGRRAPAAPDVAGAGGRPGSAQELAGLHCPPPEVESSSPDTRRTLEQDGSAFNVFLSVSHMLRRGRSVQIGSVLSSLFGDFASVCIVVFF